jgi:sec-independent protein translocase protein TatB
VLNLGTGEVLVILVVALLVLGPDKLPGAARQAGRWLGELRRLSSGFQAELRDALQEPVDQTPRSTAAVPPPQDEPEPGPGPG